MSDVVRADPTSLRITHDIELRDAEGTSLGLILCDSQGVPIQNGKPLSLRQSGSSRTSLQIRQGDADYSDYQLPYTPFTQKDWSGGRGAEDFEKDKTRYFDGNLLDTRAGDIILAGKDTDVDLVESTETIEPIEYVAADIVEELTTDLRFATKYTPVNAIQTSTISLRVAPGDCTVEIVTDDGGDPSATVVASATTDVPPVTPTTATYSADVGGDMLGGHEIGHGLNAANPLETVLVDISIVASLAAGTPYWIVITTTAYGYDDLAGGVVKKETSPGTWAEAHADNNIYFKLTTIHQGSITFFQYKNQLYAVDRPDNGSASKLYMNGYRFVAGATSTQTKLVSGISMTENELVGCVIQCIGGLCYGENPNYRKVISNTAGGDIYLDSKLLSTPDNTSEFVVIGRDKWTEIGTTGITAAVTSVMVANEQVYFAQGEAVAIRKMREYNNAGTWTRDFADEGTAKATFMKYLPAHTGAWRIWKFNNPVTGTPTAAYATPVAWGSNLDFTTKPTELAATTTYPCPIGGAGSKITGVEAYGDPIIPWIVKEDEFGSIGAGIYARVPINELKHVKSLANGLAILQFGVYLFFSVLDGFERYYDNRLDSIGPNLEEGLPADRAGNISYATSYPGGIYLAIDAGAVNYSSVLYWNQLGYNEVYRGSRGQRIRSLFVQVIPGCAVGRLWIGLGSSTAWVPVAINPKNQSTYTYQPTGSLVSGWFNGGFKEINKFWKSIQVYAENLSAGQTIAMEYMTDAEPDTWYALPTTYTTSPMQEVLMASNYSVFGKRWKYRITLTTNDMYKSPRVKAITVPSITRLPPNKSWNMTVIVDDAIVDKQGNRQILTAEQAMAQIEEWANSSTTPIPITMHSPMGMFDDKKVFIEPAGIQPVEVQMKNPKKVKAIVSLAVYEA